MNKQIQEALIKSGFTKDGNYYSKNGQKIKVRKTATLSEVFKKLISLGKTEKVWEIQNVLKI